MSTSETYEKTAGSAKPRESARDEAKHAVLYRMATSDHLCPVGLKSKSLLEREGFTVEDHRQKSREETDAFKKQHGVDTTPQTFIAGHRIGGHAALREYFGHTVRAEGDKTYAPSSPFSP